MHTMPTFRSRPDATAIPGRVADGTRANGHDAYIRKLRCGGVRRAPCTPVAATSCQAIAHVLSAQDAVTCLESVHAVRVWVCTLAAARS